MKYDFAAIEKKWQDRWEVSKPYAAVTGDPRPKFYGLIEFPYPSAAGLHVGHPRPFTAIDIVTRKKRMEGYNVLFPIGFDAFGLPTENFAIKNHIHPAIVTKQNIETFTRQLKMLGYGFDWDRVVETTDPKYYKWTQWIFLQMFKQGLAYKTTMPINWCTSCKCGLANEEVVEGVCERCGSPVIRKEKSQWMLRITKYADRLIDDLDDLDYIERVKVQQKNWIGRSTGCEVTFKTNTPDDVTVYTTRADTLFGTTYMVISPEHPLLKKWQDRIENWDEVAAYQEAASRKSDFERGELNKEKTGVQLKGIDVLNPVTGKLLPMFVSDYVLMGYGTGIVMGVPGHDQRDWEFATKFGLPIIEVVAGGDVTKEAFVAKDDKAIMVNSGFLNGMTVKEAIPAMKAYVVEQGFGKEKVNYKLRDWVFTRQRYWGEPIPLVNCPKCGWVPNLPLLRRPRQARDRHHAQLGRLLLVLPALHGSPQRHRCCQQRGRGVLGPRGLVQRRYGAHHPAPALQPLLAQVPLRYRRGAHQGALRQAHLPRHDPGQEPPLCGQRQDRGGEAGADRPLRQRGPAHQREDVQVPGQRGQPRRRGQGLRRGHHARVYHVHRRL